MADRLAGVALARGDYVLFLDGDDLMTAGSLAARAHATASPMTTDPAPPDAPPLGAGQDSDGDGLTDVFERLAGTDARRADTDGDGLLDGYEVGTSRSDPLLIDSDLDGFADAVELRLGGDPLGSQLGTDPGGADPLAPAGLDPVPGDPLVP